MAKEIIAAHGSPLVANVGAMPSMAGPATIDLLTLMLPLAVLQQALETQFPRLGSGAEIAFRAVGSHQSGGALTHAMWAVQEALDAGDAQTPQKQQRLTDMLVSSLLLAHPHNLTRELYLAGANASDTAVWDAVSVLRNAPESRVTIAELARDSGVSVRSLQLAFARLIGVTPSEYQRNLRLDMAYQLILNSDARRSLTVALLAEQVGYVNQGRFAADFARRFGLLPSVALRGRR
ncbi:AraC family transcriptional regulator [Mycolicibacterium farcinogenes]|uniref:helix-turn-helix transcriptional regulator n=1 Tax=Mycolicibacterium farcinogenes TaxID=1802 RepID=UPI0004585089|nr:helix-turn-helix transcriptional regulator [Mycolicibacterium farcinogenes]CDP86677.1 AraC family transcriptional regulator [Mycolicibacterium farcinogenes]